ncbi:uncharacterized protein LOC129566045 isoform X2 [Sitodiplosis mosellana]|uniref:uncharacterized protein LOC129566045 isoform X2 n=1 Tax=Sitodiplosis mosellana TaxID=263140 RepID=UPI002443A0D2|nr:uncharacterized protein LOC129566045 isoform X2 [Sitodiplosis mosellana]
MTPRLNKSSVSSSCHRQISSILNSCRTLGCCAILVICLVQLSLVQPVFSGINHNEFLAQLKVPQCRKDCLDKFSTDDLACLQKLDCSICWNNCAPRSGAASVVETQSTELEKSEASDVFELSVRSMVRDKSLTMADIAWYANDPAQHQCLVTWEIFGGGIMGNLLTDTHEAELSLWPDSKYHIQVTCKNKNTSKMSKSLPILIDTTTALTKAAITTTTTTTKSSLESESSGRPEAVIPSNNDDASEEKGNNDRAERPPPSLLQPHSKLATTKTAAPTPLTPTAQATDDVDDNNHGHREYDETEAIVSITRHRNYQKQHEYNNDYQITAKPLYNAHQTSMHNGDDGVVEKAGKNDNNNVNEKENRVHGTLTTSRDAAKLSKTSPSTAKITHNDIETVLSLVCVFVLVVTLVICTIVSVRQRIKSNKKHCDKTNLISSSASSSSTTSINDCEMDFNGSTTSIAYAQMTAIHV